MNKRLSILVGLVIFSLVLNLGVGHSATALGSTQTPRANPCPAGTTWIGSISSTDPNYNYTNVQAIQTLNPNFCITPVDPIQPGDTPLATCMYGDPYTYAIDPGVDASGTINPNADTWVIKLQGGSHCEGNHCLDSNSAGRSNFVPDWWHNKPNTDPESEGGLVNAMPDYGNPFWDQMKTLLPYCTQDLHNGRANTATGDGVYWIQGPSLPNPNVTAQYRVVHAGHWNLVEGLGHAYKYLRLNQVRHVLISGASAGGFGVSTQWETIYTLVRQQLALAGVDPDSVSYAISPDSGAPPTNGLLYSPYALDEYAMTYYKANSDGSFNPTVYTSTIYGIGLNHGAGIGPAFEPGAAMYRDSDPYCLGYWMNSKGVAPGDAGFVCLNASAGLEVMNDAKTNPDSGYSNIRFGADNMRMDFDLDVELTERQYSGYQNGFCDVPILYPNLALWFHALSTGHTVTDNLSFTPGAWESFYFSDQFPFPFPDRLKQLLWNLGPGRNEYFIQSGNEEIWGRDYYGRLVTQTLSLPVYQNCDQWYLKDTYFRAPVGQMAPNWAWGPGNQATGAVVEVPATLPPLRAKVLQFNMNNQALVAERRLDTPTPITGLVQSAAMMDTSVHLDDNFNAVVNVNLKDDNRIILSLRYRPSTDTWYAINGGAWESLAPYGLGPGNNRGQWHWFTATFTPLNLLGLIDLDRYELHVDGRVVTLPYGLRFGQHANNATTVEVMTTTENGWTVAPGRGAFQMWYTQVHPYNVNFNGIFAPPPGP